jgi:hypothetical protein
MKLRILLSLFIAAALGSALAGCHAEAGVDVQSSVPAGQ